MEDILKDEDDIPGPSNIDVADILPPSIYAIQRMEGPPATYTLPPMETPDMTRWDQKQQESSLTAPSPNA